MVTATIQKSKDNTIICWMHKNTKERRRKWNLSWSWSSEDCMIRADDCTQWCVVAVSITMTAVVNAVPIHCCWEWDAITSKNTARRRSTCTRHFCVDKRDEGFTINDVAVDDLLLVLLEIWRGWAIRWTRLGRRRVAESATRDGECSSSTSRMMSESSLCTAQWGFCLSLKLKFCQLHY